MTDALRTVPDGGPEAAAQAPPAVSVVVPVRNGGATIADTLTALAGQRIGVGFEVIVVDGSSTDGTVELIDAAIRQWPQIRFSRLDNPGGETSRSRNRGAAAARGTVIAFTDADCAPEPGWLAAGLAAVDRGADLVQGRTVPAGPVAALDRTLSVGHPSGLHESANLFVTRTWFERTGGFVPLPGRPISGRPFGEDTWFGWRARRAGARAAFAPDAVVRHAVFPGKTRTYLREQLRRRHFPALVAEVPELRRSLLTGGVFLTRRTAEFDAACAGAALIASGVRRRGPLAAPLAGALLAAPYARAIRRSTPTVRLAATVIAGDVLGAGALLFGSVRARTPVL